MFTATGGLGRGQHTGCLIFIRCRGKLNFQCHSRLPEGPKTDSYAVRGAAKTWIEEIISPLYIFQHLSCDVLESNIEARRKKSCGVITIFCWGFFFHPDGS